MRIIRVRGLFTIAAASMLFILPAVASMAQFIDITVMTAKSLSRRRPNSNTDGDEPT